MTQQYWARYFLLGGIMVLITLFTHLIHLVNSYDNYTGDSSPQVVSAFDG